MTNGRCGIDSLLSAIDSLLSAIDSLLSAIDSLLSATWRRPRHLAQGSENVLPASDDHSGRAAERRTRRPGSEQSSSAMEISRRLAPKGYS